MAGLDAYESDRRFQVWLYVVGHSQLLLRSNKSETESLRVEILFKSVYAMNLPTTMHGIQVRLANENEADRIRSETGCDSDIHKRARVFVLQGREYSGFVIAGVMFASEDQLDYWEPGLLQEAPKSPAEEVALCLEQLSRLDESPLPSERKERARALYERLILDAKERARTNWENLIRDIEAGLRRTSD